MPNIQYWLVYFQAECIPLVYLGEGKNFTCGTKETEVRVRTVLIGVGVELIAWASTPTALAVLGTYAGTDTVHFHALLYMYSCHCMCRDVPSRVPRSEKRNLENNPRPSEANQAKMMLLVAWRSGTYIRINP